MCARVEVVVIRSPYVASPSSPTNQPTNLPRRAQLAVAHKDHSITLRGASDGALPVSHLKAHMTAISALRFNVDGSELASGDASGVVVLWSVEGGVPTAILPHTGGGAIRSLAYNEALGPSHRQVAAGLDDGRVWMWSITDKEEPPRVVEGHTR